ncbi:MAG TPA: hypothetical protein DC048_14255 [Planctomycetaceae bacterium]|nr:hypothetical protein [Planctomycetaceae bacterium]
MPIDHRRRKPVMTREVLAAVATLVAVTCAFAPTARAQTAYPMLMSLTPTALQAGTSGTATIASRYALDGATAVLVSGEGVTGSVVPDAPPADAKAAETKAGGTPKPRESLRVTFTAVADAVPGVRDVRVVTPLGVSTVGQLLVVRDPVVVEAPPAATPPADGVAGPAHQEVTPPAAVCGTIAKAEEVDRYRFRVEPGAALGFHVWCMRLEDRVHDLQQHADPILVVRDARGSVVAASDNEFSGDPALWHTFAEGGEHTLEIRDVRYLGNVHWTYCIEISARPIVRTVFPAAVAGRAIPPLAPLGIGADASLTARVPGPAPGPDGLQEVTLTVDRLGAQRQRLMLVDGAVAGEVSGDNDTPETAATLAVPTVLNGMLDREGDVDCFTFEARKGQRLDIEVFAARLGASVDAHLRVLDDKGRQLALSDDITVGKRKVTDAAIESWTAPADGRYVLEVRDLHMRGGDAFVYALEVRESRPWFELFADTDKTLIAPGTTGVLFVRAVRRNGFNGAIQLAVDGLPAGVTASCGRILPGKGQDGCIVFQAATDAQPLAAPITILGSGRHEGDEAAPERTADAVVYQETYLPGGGRGHWPVESHVVAVSKPADIRRVTVGETAVRLAPGGSTTLDIEIERAEGFTANVLLEVTYAHLGGVFGNSLPEGVTVDASKSETLLTGGKTKGRIVLQAAANAPEAPEQQFVVMANVSLNFVMKRTYGSPPLSITLAK